VTATAIKLGGEVTLATIINGGTIPLAGVFADVQAGWIGRSSGRCVFRFSCDHDQTIGDGTFGHVVAIAGKRRRFDTGGLGPAEIIGFAGIVMGGIAPQIPMRANGGANPRDFSQIVELADIYEQLGIVGFAAAEAACPNPGQFTLTVAPILE